MNKNLNNCNTSESYISTSLTESAKEVSVKDYLFMPLKAIMLLILNNAFIAIARDTFKKVIAKKAEESGDALDKEGIIDSVTVATTLIEALVTTDFCLIPETYLRKIYEAGKSFVISKDGTMAVPAGFSFLDEPSAKYMRFYETVVSKCGYPTAKDFNDIRESFRDDDELVRLCLSNQSVTDKAADLFVAYLRSAVNTYKTNHGIIEDGFIGEYMYIAMDPEIAGKEVFEALRTVQGYYQ